jgi:hypothetical protein
MKAQQLTAESKVQAKFKQSSSLMVEKTENES